MKSYATILLALVVLVPAARADWKEDLTALVRLPAEKRGDAEVTLKGKLPPPTSYKLFQGKRTSANAIVEVGGNTFHIRASKVGAFRISIHPDLVRLEEPVRVIVNGKQVFEGLVKPDPAFLNYLENRDRKLLYVAEIAIRLGE